MSLSISELPFLSVYQCNKLKVASDQRSQRLFVSAQYAKHIETLSIIKIVVSMGSWLGNWPCGIESDFDSCK